MYALFAIAEHITRHKLMTADDSLNFWNTHSGGHVQTVSRVLAEWNECVMALRMVAGELLQTIQQTLISMFCAAKARYIVASYTGTSFLCILFEYPGSFNGVTQWRRGGRANMCSAGDSKDADLMPAVAGTFLWRRNAKNSFTVRCQCILKKPRWSKLSGALHCGIPHSLSRFGKLNPIKPNTSSVVHHAKKGQMATVWPYNSHCIFSGQLRHFAFAVNSIQGYKVHVRVISYEMEWIKWFGRCVSCVHALIDARPAKCMRTGAGLEHSTSKFPELGDICRMAHLNVCTLETNRRLQQLHAPECKPPAEREVSRWYGTPAKTDARLTDHKTGLVLSAAWDTQHIQNDVQVQLDTLMENKGK